MKVIVSYIYRVMFYFLATFFPVRKKTILFESFNGKLPGDNPYAIYNEFISNHEHSDWQVYWGIKKQYLKTAQEKFPEIHFVVRFSLPWLLLAPRASFWIFNARMPIWLKKNKQTTYFQTWHGTPLKKLGLDIENVSIPGATNNSYKKDFIKESSRWDFLVAPNDYSKAIFKRAFQFQNEFLEVGYPRNDYLVKYGNSDKHKKLLKGKILGKNNGKVILYAPTWRDDYYISKGNYKFEMAFQLKEIFSVLDEEDILIIRPHYLVEDSINIEGFEDRVLVTTTEDINYLYIISDFLITDYSSVMFDFAELGKPMLFYPYDLNHYENNLRGFYIDYMKELPGAISKQESEFYQELNYMIKSTSSYSNEFSDKYIEFQAKYCKRTSNSSQIIVNKILEIQEQLD
jgi:CDP-glycerol glycerophosphotransferase